MAEMSKKLGGGNTTRNAGGTEKKKAPFLTDLKGETGLSFGDAGVQRGGNSARPARRNFPSDWGVPANLPIGTGRRLPGGMRKTLKGDANAYEKGSKGRTEGQRETALRFTGKKKVLRLSKGVTYPSKTHRKITKTWKGRQAKSGIPGKGPPGVLTREHGSGPPGTKKSFM